MVWVLVLHISTVMLWIAALFYVPIVVAATDDGRVDLSQPQEDGRAIERLLFTHVATPAAVAAIISGTAVFLLNRTTDGWLIAKLTLVTGLVVCHTLAGLLVLQAGAWHRPPLGLVTAEDAEIADGSLAGRCRWLLGALTLTVAGILWLVLAKPSVPLAQGG